MEMFRLSLWMIVCLLKMGGILSEPTMSLLKLNNEFFCTLTNDSSDSALFWGYQNTEDTARSNTWYCDIQKKASCQLESIPSGWQWIDDTDSSPIFDRRWESIKGEQIYEAPSNVYESDGNSFRLSFSLKAVEVHIFLCDKKYDGYSYGNCFWIALGADKGKTNYFRKCATGAIPIRITMYPEEPCKNRLKESHMNNILDEKRWKHFTLIKMENKITLLEHNLTNPILEYPDDEDSYKFKYVCVRNADWKKKPAFMKVHKVRTLFASSTSAGPLKINLVKSDQPKCFALYAKTCRDCELTIKLSNENSVLTSAKAEKLDGWQRIILKTDVDLGRESEISIKVSKSSGNRNGKWYISNCIQRCDTNDIPVVPGGNIDGCCYALKYPDISICTRDLSAGISPTGKRCGSNEIGENCIPCKSVSGSDCQGSKICDITSAGLVCSCSSGYRGSDCSTTCASGFYGHSCSKQCGKCSNTCNIVDGRCYCDDNFLGDTCDTPELPIVKQAPTTRKAENRRLILALDLNYEGVKVPKWYLVEYKQHFDNWKQAGSQSVYVEQSVDYIIPNLQPNTNYMVRALLITQNNEVYKDKHVPVLTIKTTCTDVTFDVLREDVTNTSINIELKENNSELCPFSQFRLYLYENDAFKEHLQLAGRNFFNGLKPCQEYRIDIIKGSITIANRVIITEVGVPDKVQNIKYQATDTSVLLIWNYPQNTNCKIDGYRVEYTRTRSNGCGNLLFSGDTKAIQESDKEITINSLVPYSHYRVKVRAFNIYEGAGESVEFDTKEKSAPTEEEYPTFSISNPKKELIINFQWNCTALQGPLQFKVLLLCRNDWCRDEVSPEDSIYSSMLEVKHKFIVTGKTNYTLRMSISRNGQEISRDFNILTEPTEPNAVRNLTVYSKNSASMSVRWLPPYPPTGDIECYFVKYHDSYSSEIKVEKTSECKLWKGYICTTITNLSYDKIIYITLIAMNIGVKENGTAARINSRTKEEESEPPQNIILKWDEGYNLTVKWQHPDRTNGDLVQFLLTANDSNLPPFDVKIVEAEYEYKYKIPLNLTSKVLNIGVAAKNSAGISSKITGFTYSPPRVPEFSIDPFVEDIKNTSFVLRIPQISNIEGDMSNMYIIITDIAQPLEREFLHPMSRELMEKINVKSENSWIIGEFNLRNTTIQNGLLFEVGDDRETLSKIEDTWKFKNRKLNTGRTYNVYFLFNNTFMQFHRYRSYSIRDVVLSGQSSTSLLYLLILLVLPVILCIVCVIIVRRHRQKVTSSIYVGLQQLGISRNTRDVPMRPLVRENNTPTPENSIAKPTAVVHKKIEEPATDDDRKYTKPIKLNDLHQYIKESIENGEFERQHGVFQRGQTKPWTQGTKPQNKAKNRYTNLAAYDHTRVKLEIINKDPFSDYINANYIDGYKSQKAYIATQGPKVSTLNDFWRMIWQENVEYIIMIANLIEGGKKKVEKYWPEINESKDFDNIRVKYLSVDVMANYEIRYFNVSCCGENRKIQQLHFLTWPDHGVPLYAQSLSPFLKKMLTIPQGKSPVVVHCSAGVGRTGSLILCDICLRMAAREGKIDVFYYLNKIRNQRVNMVDNVEQYKLVHLVLLQCLVAPETGFLCNETMEKSVDTIISTKIEEEMNYLEESSWQDEAMRTSNVHPDLPIIASKNRFANVSIESSSRICLSPYPSSDEASTYINAVSVDAFATPSKFIVTQNPLNSTVGDFWRLVEENQITMIICLNQLDFQDKTTCKFYPTSSAQPMKPVPYLEIKYTGKEVNTHFKVYSVTMSRLDGQEDDVHLKIMHLNNWRNNATHPENPIGLLMAYEEMNRLGRTSDTILISCHDGVKACGLYVAMCFVIDKIKMEQICDVCLAVRTVRHGRKEFVRDAKQFAFLYQCGLEYVRQFEMYSNFSSTKLSK